MDQGAAKGFSSSFPIEVLKYKTGQTPDQWREIDRGPGYFNPIAGWDLMVRIRNIDDSQLKQLIQELAVSSAVTFLYLAENRKITDEGLLELKHMPWLTGLNLSSCSLNDPGLAHLTALPRLATLNLSFCNRLTDKGLRNLQNLRQLSYLDLQGCIKITRKGIALLERRGLEIHTR